MEEIPYIIEWEFENQAEALKAWWREVPKAFRVVSVPVVTEIPSPFGGSGKGYRVIGMYTTGD